MSADAGPQETEATDEQTPADDALAAQVALLQEENDRLRAEYARARRVEYRRTALGLAAVGLVAALGGLLFPGSRRVLFALAGTGLFGAVLTYYLTPETVIPASVGERVYSAFAATAADMVAELGLTDERVYVPTGEGEPGVRLFVPQSAADDRPAPAALADVFVVGETPTERGLALDPTGGPLFAEFERALVGSLADEPAALADQLVDGLAEQFELVESARVADAADQVTVAITGSAYGAVDRFDHPVASFLGVGIARGLDVPVELAVTPADDDRFDYLVTCSWGGDDRSSEEAEQAETPAQ